MVCFVSDPTRRFVLHASEGVVVTFSVGDVANPAP